MLDSLLRLALLEVRFLELKGTRASPGVAVGQAFWLRPAVHTSEPQGEAGPVDVPGAGPAAEQSRLNAAVAQARAELQSLQQQLGAEAAEIFGAHALMLEDPGFLAPMAEAIQSGATAQAAACAAVAEWRDAFAALDDPYLRARASDVEDLGRRLDRILNGRPAPPHPAVPSVILADDLTPSDTAGLRKLALAFVLAGGGPTSHAAILARQWGIPVVTGVSGLERIQDGDQLLIDGEEGLVRVSPSPELIRLVQPQTEFQSDPAPALTRDGIQMEVGANAADLADVRLARTLGADGIGLLRSELLFLEHRSLPSEAEQAGELGRIVDAMEGRPVILRLLDVGGDKPLPYLPVAPEANPFLGQRGIRLLLGPYIEALRVQLRAAARVAGQKNLKVMLPMVTSPTEVVQVRGIIEAEGIASLLVGMMVETPAAALMARSFAPCVDFFSIGTNDLTQYTLAVDRGNHQVAELYDPLNPAVLRLIQMTAEAGLWTGICGEIAADPLAVPLWLAWGIREVSVAPPAVAGIKKAVRAWTVAEARAVAAEAVAAPGAEAVRALLKARRKAV